MALPVHNRLLPLFNQPYFIDQLMLEFQVVLLTPSVGDPAPYFITIVEGPTDPFREILQQMNDTARKGLGGAHLLSEILDLCRQCQFSVVKAHSIIRDCPDALNPFKLFLQCILKNRKATSVQIPVNAEVPVKAADLHRREDAIIFSQERLMGSTQINKTMNPIDAIPPFENWEDTPGQDIRKVSGIQEDLPVPNILESASSTPVQTNASAVFTKTVPSNQPELLNSSPASSRHSVKDTGLTTLDPKKKAKRSSKPKLNGLTKDHRQVDKKPPEKRLRPIIIDGMNVAKYPTGEFKPDQIVNAVTYFFIRGHEHISVILPMALKGKYPQLEELNRSRYLHFIPRRIIDNKVEQAHDDLCVLEMAMNVDGVIVSNDQYRNEVARYPQFQQFVRDRLLSYIFNGTELYIPLDVHGSNRPTRDEILAMN